MGWKQNMTEEEKVKWLMEEQDEGIDESGDILTQWEKRHREEMKTLSEIDQLKIIMVISKTKLSLEELDKMSMNDLLTLYE